MNHLSVLEILIRASVAAVLGALIGLDRELSDQPAGLRTHILVAEGSALFTMAGSLGFGAGVDPTRIAAQVVTGIGFLGAGAILRQGANVRGLTTAAGLWVTAAVGVAVAFGFWPGALITTAITVASLFGLKRFESSFLKKLKPGRFEFVVDLSHAVKMSEVSDRIEAARAKVEEMREIFEEGARRLELFVRVPPRVSPREIAQILEELPGVETVDWSK